MHIHDGIGVGTDQLLGEDHHAACQHHQVDLQLPELFHQRHGHGPVGAQHFWKVWQNLLRK